MSSLKRWRQVGQGQFRNGRPLDKSSKASGKERTKDASEPSGRWSREMGASLPSSSGAPGPSGTGKAQRSSTRSLHGPPDLQRRPDLQGFRVFVAEPDGWGEPMTPMALPFGKEV